MQDAMTLISEYQVAEATGWTLEYIRNLSYWEWDTINNYRRMVQAIEKEALKK